VTETGETQQQEVPRKAAPAFAFWLVFVSILIVMLTFLSTMLMFRESLVEDGALVVAAMTSTFTVVGTLVATYFGLKAARDAQESTLRKIPSADMPQIPAAVVSGDATRPTTP
jgi:glucan phosphoethanolaminetransferase (alkaline phosphatase superfamily)